jgi:hypothetical protein
MDEMAIAQGLELELTHIPYRKWVRNRDSSFDHVEVPLGVRSTFFGHGLISFVCSTPSQVLSRPCLSFRL